MKRDVVFMAPASKITGNSEAGAMPENGKNC
jgi:hypothetical protein